MSSAVPRILLLIVVALLAACDRSPSSTEYFPLEPGLQWQYVVHEKNPVTDREQQLDIRNLKAVKREGERYVRRLASDGNEYWLSVTDSAIQRAGVRTAIDFEPRIDTHPLTVMQLPPTVGQWWEADSRPFILERVEPFRERFSQDESKRISLSTKVAALDDVVEVPAGKFERCLRLEGTGVLNVLADARIGASEVPVVHTEWYAPGVGLIKLVRTETLATEAIVGGEITMELIGFQR